MKKITLVMSVIIMAALLAFSAAAEAQVFEADTDNSFDISYTGTPGEYYAIVIVEGIVEEGAVPAITEDTIQYIDQKTAGANGTVSFENVLLFEDGTEATVFLGGSDLPGAVVLGWVNKPNEEETFTVSGTVTSVNDSVATVTLTINGESVYVNTDSTGAYTIDVPAGTYTFVAEKAKHLSYTKNAFEVVEDTIKDVSLTAGDINADGSIGLSDLNSVLSTYLSSDDLTADINEDGSIGLSDLNAILGAYLDTKTVE